MVPEKFDQQPDDKKTAVNIGNASNPAPRPDDAEPLSDNQILSEGAEKYLREVASIEDYPDARDDEEMDKTIKEDQ
ncbi:MAG: hypothetical protein EOO10_01740 [Chitinophagaceae bacterium]|nr:MAG: hypothetical protein EOO10_01740 [Chitinophagaceae bacterium]